VAEVRQASNGTNAIGELNMANGTYILQDAEPSCATANAAPCIPAGAQHIVVSPNGRLWDTPKNNWGPRIGLAYRLNDKTSIRSGFGIFYDQSAGITQTVQHGVQNGNVGLNPTSVSGVQQ
jgi:hypothetical protein